MLSLNMNTKWKQSPRKEVGSEIKHHLLVQASFLITITDISAMWLYKDHGVWTNRHFINLRLWYPIKAKLELHVFFKHHQQVQDYIAFKWPRYRTCEHRKCRQLYQCLHMRMHILQCWKIHFFVFVWRWWCSEWARSTDTTATKNTVDTAFLPPVACSTHTYRGPRGKMTVRHHTSMMALSMPFSVYTYFTETVTLLVVETTRYYHWCKDSLDMGPSPKPDLSSKCLCFWQ